MGERTQYTPGTFSWVDLTTPDQAAAKSFYGSLFGWEADDRPVAEGVVYSMQQIGGKSVAAISPPPPDWVEQGLPPAWSSYVTVESADATAERAPALGANVLDDPFDVMTAGRMAVISDPHGAYFMVWEPRDTAGAELVNGPGMLTWNELVSPDLDASAAFYGELFGWTFERVEQSPIPYQLIKLGDRLNGGMATLPQEVPPHWIIYFGSTDAAADLRQIEELGGTVVMPADDVGMGIIGVAKDAQGASFGLFQGDYDD